MIQMSKETIYEELEEAERQIESGQTLDAIEHLESMKDKYGLQ